MLKIFNRAATCFLFLSLFLYPQVQKNLHDFEHRYDLHCDSESQKHIHTLEHTCTVCDFTLPFVTHSITGTLTFSRLIQPQVYFSRVAVQDIFFSGNNIPPRAPPVA
jgi:hypothetical protein